MTRLNKAYSYFEYVKKISILLSGIAIFGMILLIAVDVFSRNILSSSISGGYEIVQNYFMPLASFTVILYAYSSGVMPRISMFVEKMPDIIQKTLHLIMLFLELFIILLIAYYSLTYALRGTESGMAFPSGGVLFPLYPFLYLVPIGFAGIVIEILFIIAKNFSNKGVWVTFDKKQNETKVTDQAYVS